jgi:hypothetical protein
MSIGKALRSISLCALLVSALACTQAEPGYDTVILGGRVMDPETGFDAVANVGIRDGRIASITRNPISGAEVIDAEGLVVSAGFIDTHFHWPRPVGYKLALRDGVTTPMDLEFGTHGPRVGDWYDMHEGRSQANYGTAVSHEAARATILDGVTDGFDAPGSGLSVRAGKGWAHGVLDADGGNQLLEMMDAGLRDGALGNCSTLGYWPGALAREMFEVQRLAGKYGRVTGVHTRYTPGTVVTEVNGAQEILANAVALKAPAAILHYNNPGWELVQELLVRLRGEGHNVWGEYYPYAAGATTINAAFLRPEMWIEKLGKRYEDTLQDPLTGNFMTQAQYEQFLATDPTKQIVLYKMPVEEIPKWIAQDGVIAASDGMPAVTGDWDQLPWDIAYEDIPNTHPRTAGTHGKSLRIARDNNIPLMHVLATFSYYPAKYLGATGLKAMQERGRMQEGMVADITIFDPNTVQDNATYADGTLPSTGIPYVLVNGTTVVKDSRVLPDVYPGQPIRFPVEEKGRHEAFSEEAWNAQYLVPSTGFRRLDAAMQ